MPDQLDKRFTPVGANSANPMHHEVTNFMNLVIFI